MEVSEKGGRPSSVTEPFTPGGFHIFPTFLPDGRHFLYHRARDRGGIWIGSIDSKANAQKLQSIAPATYVIYVPAPDKGPGQLLFLREATLLTQTFHPETQQVDGAPMRVADQVGSFLASGFFSASRNGTLVYCSRTLQDFLLTWTDRSGRVLGTVGETGRYNSLALSPNGLRAAVSRVQRQNPLAWDLWLLDLVRNTSIRFTFQPGEQMNYPVWSPEGGSIIYGEDHGGGRGNIYRKPTNSAADQQTMLESGIAVAPSSWSRDGRYLLYTQTITNTLDGIFVLSLNGEQKAKPLLEGPFNQSEAQFSPDGRWIAYTSDETGRNEVYVRPFSRPGEKQIVSLGGGSEPHWPDGNEILYVAPDGNVMSAEVSVGTAFRCGAPKVLFRAPHDFGRWDVTSDGKRFLFAVPAEQHSKTAFTVVLNWQAALAKSGANK
jgi:hypothetical protein